MKKPLAEIGALLCAVSLSAGLSGCAVQDSVSEVPEFVLPESSTADESGTSSQRQTAESTTAAADKQSVSEQPEATSAQTTAETTQTTQTTPSEQAEPEETAAAASAETTAATEAAVPVETESNILLTSHDPLHYVRIEFDGDLIRYSGVYTGTTVDMVRIFRPEVISENLALSGDEFSGTLDVSGFDDGYYIFVVTLGTGAQMYYVFEVEDGSSGAVPADELPAAENLAFIDAPLELSSEGVLHQITVTDDTEKAEEILAEVKSLSDQICAGLDDDYDKARALCEWVGENIYYDEDASKNGVTEEVVTLEYVLEYHRSVCFGWSNLYAALCQAQGIRCYNVSGSCVTGSRCFLQTELSDEHSHSWNLVETDGRYIWVDTVWNSTNAYKKNSYFSGTCDMQYFDIDAVLLSHDHRISRLEYRDYYR